MAHFQDKGNSLVYCLKEPTVHTGQQGRGISVWMREKARLAEGRLGQEKDHQAARECHLGNICMVRR